LGTYTITQSKRDLKNEDLRNNTLILLSSKSRQFISLQMLYIKRTGLDVPLFVERYFYSYTFKCMGPIGWGCGKTLGGIERFF